MKSFNFVKKESKKTDLCVNYRDKFVFFCNSSKGITLIALVVSIIVILILACIAINVTIGKDGIISKSQNAKLQEYESEVEFEVLSGLSSLDTEYYTKTTADSGVNVYSIYNVDGLQKYVSGKINGFNYNKDGTTTVYYTNSNGTYTVKIDQAGVATTYSSFQVQENEVVRITKIQKVLHIIL
jgi:competence protein ComGC